MNEFDELIEKVANAAMDYMENGNFHPDKLLSSKMDLAIYKSLLKNRINILQKERDEAVAKIDCPVAIGWHFISMNPESQPDKDGVYEVLRTDNECYSTMHGWGSEFVVAWKEMES